MQELGKEHPLIAGFNLRMLLPVFPNEFCETAKALRHEHRDCSRWKRLTSRRVSVYSERERRILFAFHAGSTAWGIQK